MHIIYGLTLLVASATVLQTLVVKDYWSLLKNISLFSLIHFIITKRTTWHAPNGRTDNQIDYILTPQRFKSSIITTSTRTYPGADIGSDHDLVLCNLKLKLCIRKIAITNRIRFDLDKLENATTVNDYKVKLDLELSQVKINENDITETCNMVEKAILLIAEKIYWKI